MEKSGPWNSTSYPLIIDRPDLQSWPQRAISGVLTTVFWLLWLVLCLPLLTLMGWALFGWQFRVHMFDLGGLGGFFEILGTYAIVIVSMGSILLGWAKYNHLRFRGMDRRMAFPPVTPAAIAMALGHSEEDVLAWQEMRAVTVEHGGVGEIRTVTAAVVSAGSGQAGTVPQALAA